MLANTVDPNQMPHYVASDLGLHPLPMTFFGVSRLEWVKLQCFSHNCSCSICTCQIQYSDCFHYLRLSNLKVPSSRRWSS